MRAALPASGDAAAHPLLPAQLQCVKRLPFTNWLVVALDETLRDYLQKNNVNVYYRPVVVRY